MNVIHIKAKDIDTTELQDIIEEWGRCRLPYEHDVDELESLADTIASLLSKVNREIRNEKDHVS